MEFTIRIWKNGVIGFFVVFFMCLSPASAQNVVLRASIRPEAHAAAEFVSNTQNMLQNINSFYGAFFTMLSAGTIHQDMLEEFLKGEDPAEILELLAPAGERLFREWPKISMNLRGGKYAWSLLPKEVALLSNSLQGIGIFTPKDISSESKKRMMGSRVIFPTGIFHFEIPREVRRSMGDFFHASLQRLLGLYSNLSYDERETSLIFVVLPGVKTLEHFIEQSRISP